MKSSYMKQMLSGNRQYRRAFVLAVAVPILCAAAAALVLRVMKELGLDYLPCGIRAVTGFNCLTCGAIGSYVFTANEESYVATPKVKVADTVGAGDSFTATFVAQLLLGKPIPEAHKKAVDVSAFVCTQNGAMPVLPEELKV